MKLVIGGMAQGKLDYVKKNMLRSDEKYNIIDCREYEKVRAEDSMAADGVLVLYNFNYMVKNSVLSGTADGNLESGLRILMERQPDMIIISDEVGNGIVPIDKTEREYREKTGRILIELAKHAEEVVRVICGIGQKIK